MAGSQRGKLLRISASVVATCLFFLVAACSPADDGEAPARWTVERDGRFGSVDDERYPWAYIRELVIGPEGRLYVAPSRIPSVWVYEATGEHVRTIGRGGDGPGEFSAVTDLGFHGDTLWVRDAPSGNLSFFELQGQYLDRIHFSVVHPSGNLIVRPDRLLGDGSVFSEALYRMRAVVDGDLDRVPLLRLTRAGEVRDTLAWKVLRREAFRIEFEPGGLASTGRHPFPTSTLHAVGPSAETIYVVDPEPSPRADHFRVVAVGLTGDTVWRRDHAFTPVPLQETYLDSLVAEEWAGERSLRDRLTEDRFREAYLEALDAPSHLPPVTDAKVNSDGTIWIRREERLDDTIRWWALDSQGDLVAELEIPASIGVLALSGDTIWGVETDALDVPWIVRLRVGEALSSRE